MIQVFTNSVFNKKVERNASGEFIEVEKAAVEKIISKIEKIQEETDNNEEMPIEQTPCNTVNHENNYNEPLINGTKTSDVTDKSSSDKKVIKHVFFRFIIIQYFTIKIR